jgi:FkbM family methyltransferase
MGVRIDGPLGAFEIPGEPEVTRRTALGITEGVWDGEYAHEEIPKTGINRILDIGAGWGAYVVWAHKNWPEASIDCYEPHETARKFLEANIINCKVPNVTVHGAAVTVKEKPLFGVGEDWGSATTHFNDTGVPVAAIHPKDLPPADMLKCDAEGVEIEIVPNYPHLKSLKVLIYEFHNRQYRRELREFCEKAGLRCLKEDSADRGWGVAIWVPT